ncbi:nitrite reductase small subunit NirD [Modestobacter roseus]|uniref:Nitrite reductase (NADH) small subunit n=1 Tax=Modestobacter roseus TaxID=1181884 RepID=A0A562IQS4_9ACTN|nr:nitrite reductase small subunit NirD [Modestobacter roseus]MQA34439.1 nitrite reductase small subunit NirD [Modestobacter roseus]TWH73075.1 nitrite reductase (NADH) small subunit [Modestobacter roseus]
MTATLGNPTPATTGTDAPTITATATTGTATADAWTPICAFDDLLPERGVAALVDGVQVAVFRLFDGSLHAVGHRDPFSGAYVLARGLVGTRGNAPTVASPMYKQVFDLRTGACLDDPSVSVPVHRVRVRDGQVEVALG